MKSNPKDKRRFLALTCVIVFSSLLVACGDNSPTVLPPAFTPTAVAAISTETTLANLTVAQDTVTIVAPTSPPTPTVAVTAVPASTTTIASATTFTPSLSLSATKISDTTLLETPTATRKPTATKTTIPTPKIAPTSAPVKTQSASSSQGYIKVHILAGPTCPVENLNDPCPPRPVANRAIYVKDSSGTNTLQTGTSDANGYALIGLGPGTYKVEVARQGPQSDKGGPHSVNIVAGQTATLEIMLDTGIR